MYRKLRVNHGILQFSKIDIFLTATQHKLNLITDHVAVTFVVSTMSWAAQPSQKTTVIIVVFLLNCADPWHNLSNFTTVAYLLPLALTKCGYYD